MQFITEHLDIILNVVYALCGVVAAVLGLIIPLVKNSKAKKALQTSLKVLNFIESAVPEAEKFLNYTGAEKKEWVKAQAMKFCVENRIEYTEAQIDEFIEQVITLSKTVNARDKDKRAQQLKG